MKEILNQVFSFLKSLVSVIGEDVRKVTMWIEEKGLLTLLTEVLEILGLELISAIENVINPKELKLARS